MLLLYYELTHQPLRYNKNLTDDAIQKLASCALATLKIGGCTKVTRIPACFPSLTNLDACRCSLTDEGLDGIQVCSGLQVLGLDGCKKLSSGGKYCARCGSSTP